MFDDFSAPKGKTPTGGDVWVLLITDTKPSDSDLYICEVNSDPPIKSFHSLKGTTNDSISVFFFLHFVH